LVLRRARSADRSQVAGLMSRAHGATSIWTGAIPDLLAQEQTCWRIRGSIGGACSLPDLTRQPGRSFRRRQPDTAVRLEALWAEAAAACVALQVSRSLSCSGSGCGRCSRAGFRETNAVVFLNGAAPGPPPPAQSRSGAGQTDLLDVVG
jgi:hypothetical protein